MNDWIQAIYDATGIPLEEDDLSVGRYGTQWWLELHRYPVFPIGEDPNRHASITLVKRKALTRGISGFGQGLTRCGLTCT